MSFTEAPASVTFTAITPKGYSVLITFRNESWEELLKKVLQAELDLEEKGFKHQAKKSFTARPQKPIEQVQGRVCPKCRSNLIYFMAKGKKHIKCSTQRWDPKTRKATGCDFVEWSDSPKPTLDEEFPDRE